MRTVPPRLVWVAVAGLVAIAAGVLAGTRPDGTVTSTGTPLEVRVSAGAYHTCALIDGEQILCWGLDDSGQLGGGSPGPLGNRKLVGNASAIEDIDVGGEHSCFIARSGRLYCWGHNGNGQIGDGTVKQRWLPTWVARLPERVVDVSVGEYHTCAVDEVGGVYCWGRNANGQIGDGGTADRPEPHRVGDLAHGRVVAAGDKHTCVLLVDGGVSCWGENSSGELGDGSTDTRPTPGRVEGLDDVISLAVGGAHTCAVVADGRVYCWGRNEFSQLGDGTDDDMRTPVEVADVSDAVAVTAGAHHTCALLAGRRALCWGQNSGGQLGLGVVEDGLDDRGTPPSSVLLEKVAAVEAGGVHTCAVTAEQQLYCWGYNSSTQVGDLSTDIRPKPVLIDLSPADQRDTQ